MKIQLCPNRNRRASGWLALFLVVIVIIFLGLFVSMVAKCAKLPVRTHGGDDATNSMAANFTWNSPLPLRMQSQPEDLPPGDPPGITNVFQASVQFLWEDCMTNGVLVILRSLDWQEWTMLYNVWFREQTFTNIVMVNACGEASTNLATNIEFLDADAPAGAAFYKGLVITNALVRPLQGQP